MQARGYRCAPPPVADRGVGRGRPAVNRNVPNGRERVLGVIGGLPTGTPVAFEAAFEWGWLIKTE